MGRFKYCTQLTIFKEKLANNEIDADSIVFIEDAKLLWTHGSYYNCSDAVASQQVSGLMSSEDKIKLDNISDDIILSINNVINEKLGGNNIKTVTELPQIPEQNTIYFVV